jgi:eukaryotic-like serine/threonine-protein kinase
MMDPSDAPTLRSRARVGLVLRDKWKLESLLGVGGMAAVYAATHTNNGRRGAIKLLHPELSMNAEVRGRFLREGYAANKVEHPGTVAVLDDDVAEDGSVFLVMELLDGETLEERRERAGVLPPAEVLFIVEKILDVLAAAHPKGIVHRDLKPENIFLCRDGVVKVLDFGIARVREASSASAGKQTMTNAGPMGTPAYMPPEQARGRWTDVGPRTDLWAIGATMFTLLTGRLVHEAETVNELLLAAMTKPSPPLASVMPGVSTALAGIVDRALAYAAADRWADAATMQSAVRLVLRGLAVDASSGGDMSMALTAKYVDPLPPVGTPPLSMPPPRAAAPSAAFHPSAPLPPQQMPAPIVAPFGDSRPQQGPPPGYPAFVAPGPSQPMLALAPAAIMATGHPVTIGSDVAARTGVPAASRGKAGFVIVGAAVIMLLCGIGAWAAFGQKTPVPAEQPPPTPPTAASIVEPAPPPPEPPASAAVTAAPSASAAAPAKTTAPPRVPVVPLKPKPKSEQELLNRRH